MVGRANLNIRLAICVLALAGPVWNFTTVHGQTLCDYPPDGNVISGDTVLYLGDDYIWTKLIFVPGATAVSFIGYFSDNRDDVVNRIEDANLGPPPYASILGWEYTFFAGNPQVPPVDDSLVRGTKYYWTVDAKDAEGNEFPGDVWEFTIQGFYAFAPSPPNEATFVSVNPFLSWLPGFGPPPGFDPDTNLEHDVYIGTSWEDVNNAEYDFFNQPPEFVATRSDPNYQCSGLARDTKIFWRIDEIWGRMPPPEGGGHYYKGDVWEFTTGAVPIFVDIDATGINNGSSWANAYLCLQDALNRASSDSEIFVAEGTYKPDQGGGQTPSDRTATFRLNNGVTIKGGYAGVSGPDPNERDIEVYETILSGDIGTEGVDSDNSYHVVTGGGTDATAVLDGFTITGGNATGSSSPDNCGGGMLNDNSSSPTVTNCTFSGNNAAADGGGMWNGNGSDPKVTNCTFNNNSANWAGGMYNLSNSSPTVTDCNFSGNEAANGGGGMINNISSSPTVTNCTFSGNNAAADGGGMWNGNGSDPNVTNCAFSGNEAGIYGGGIYNTNSNPTVANCSLSQNTAGTNGGGIYNASSSPTIINCTISGNTATGNGGGMFNDSGSPTVINCAFSGNTAGGYGGGMRNWISSPTVTNCTFSGNTAGTNGGGMFNANNSNPNVTNCIFWGDSPDEIDNNASTPTVTYCDVDGGWLGLGNIDAAPCFVDAAGGDLRLKPDSPCIDAGDTTAVPGGIWADLGGNPRVSDDPENPDTGISLFGLTVDMGAYEFQPCRIAGDNNCDGVVDFKDLAILAGNWLAGVNVEPPSQASNPNPADGATEVSTTADLSWTAGAFAESHDVYFGTSSPPPFIQNQTAATFDPGTMTGGTTYYWRIDEVNTHGTTTGEVWRFTTFGPPP